MKPSQNYSLAKVKIEWEFSPQTFQQLFCSSNKWIYSSVFEAERIILKNKNFSFIAKSNFYILTWADESLYLDDSLKAWGGANLRLWGVLWLKDLCICRGPKWGTRVNKLEEYKKSSTRGNSGSDDSFCKHSVSRKIKTRIFHIRIMFWTIPDNVINYLSVSWDKIFYEVRYLLEIMWWDVCWQIDRPLSVWLLSAC